MKKKNTQYSNSLDFDAIYCQEWEEYKGQLGGSEELSDAQLAARLQVIKQCGSHIFTMYSSFLDI